MRRFITSLGLGASAAGVCMLLAAPASAAGLTSSSTFDVTYPDKRPAQSYYVYNTAELKNGMVTGKSLLSWQILDDVVVDSSKRFTSFKITSRIEERLTKTGEDHVVTSKTCDMTKLVNDNATWFRDEPVNNCVPESSLYDGEVFWSTDSTIVYDIEGDGKGPITQQLTGSPLIHG
ncbi:hypothetical protein AB0L75_25650 [Streptomyces sp. NPDC052101]|uniref:hypothetical protein n=1 Tax=Streptomyces sp. NPDC052101 TaxID=3155763 RepID=UPI003419CD43